MPTLLLEIGVEELPAAACEEAAAQLPALAAVAFGGDADAVYVGPRRLAIVASGLADYREDMWVKGPPASIAFDEDGRPTKAAEGFARREGVTVDKLEIRQGAVGFLRKGECLRAALPGVLAGIIEDLRFRKTMVWNETKFRFPRPIRWLCAKLDAETIPFELAGVEAGGFSFGHRFTSGKLNIDIPEAYAGTLRNGGVEPDQSERKRLIVDGLDALGEWRDPLRKLEEVVHLVESPMVLEGRFDEQFLKLPPRVVEVAMQSHQRYFPLGGNRFAVVANGGDADVVREGHERVLENRLDDATFTFERDVAKGIDHLAQQLDRITFIAGGGTFAEKAERLVELVQQLGGGDASVEAARLAKADQAAELVREFPELEGHIGAEYARLAGYPEAVCAAIDEQYLPDSAGGPLPETEAGKILAAADKLDNLNVAFALGHRPTGSRDPFGLRRAAIGLCRLAVEGGLEIARDLLGGEVGDFVEDRLENLVEVPVEFVRAARRSAASDLRGVAELAKALAALPKEQLETIHTAYTRAARIAEKSGEAAEALDPALLTEPAELEVVRVLAEVEPEVRAALAERDYDRGFAAAARLGPVLERFFDEVLVMAEDASIRATRLRLLLDVRDALGLLGDFSEIPV